MRLGSLVLRVAPVSRLLRLRPTSRKLGVGMRRCSASPVAPHSDAEASGTRRIAVRSYGRLLARSSRTGESSAVFCLVAALAAAGHAAVFTYELDMSYVDSVEGATVYPTTGSGRPAVIGFGEMWTASKRLPFAIGPGRVRVYVTQYIEKPDREVSVAIGAQERTASVSSELYRYHQAELVFDLEQATDQVTFRARTVGAPKGRIIWYKTVFTNDPKLTYVKQARKRGKEWWSTVYQEPVPENAAGNLLPNSGFEAGLRGWDMQPYRSNLMVKPSLLSRRAAHGNYSLDVGKMLIMSRRFVLKGERTYRFSLHVAEENPLPVSGRIEAAKQGQSRHRDYGDTVLTFDTAQAEPSGVDGWRVSRFEFETRADPETPGGEYQIVLQATQPAEGGTSPSLGPAVLVDSLQILEGDGPLAVDAAVYEPCQGVEAGFISPVTQAIFPAGEPAEAVLNLHAAPDVQVRSCSYAVYDYFDQCVAPFRELSIEGAAPQCTIALDTSRAGFFRIRTRLDYSRRDRDSTRGEEFFYNVVRLTPPRRDRREKSLLGAYYVYPPVEPFGWAEVARAFGFHELNTLGSSLMRWTNNIAPGSTPDSVTYDWTDADRQVEAFEEAGVSIALQFHVAKNSYAVPECCRDPGADPATSFRFDGTRQSGDEAFSRKQWLEYVLRFLERYRGRFSKVVVQDEPTYYFSPAEYARFYLATREAVKAADPNMPVFFDAFIAKDMVLVDALNQATNGRAHEMMDGVHVYLDGQHNGRVSSQAAKPFRDWVRRHDLPLVTVTCYSSAYRLDTKPPGGPPRYLDLRDREARSVQYLLDGVIWGGSTCFYYYYGAHTGRRDGTYIFDEFGRVKPVFHFYAAANHLLGGHVGTESLDSFPNLRVGLVRTGPAKGIAVLYSVDGRIYDFALDAPGVSAVLDGFGNPVEARRHDGKVHYHLSRHPIYVTVADVAEARTALRDLEFREKLPVRFTYGAHPDGVLQVRAWIRSDSPLEAYSEIGQVRDPRAPATPVPARKVRDGVYALDVPLPEPTRRTVVRTLPLRLATNWGDLSSEFPVLYAAITLTEGDGRDDGVIGEEEWPSEQTGWVPLRQVGGDDGATRASTPAKGAVCLMLQSRSLRGALRLESRRTAAEEVRMVLVPVSHETGESALAERMELTIDPAGEAGAAVTLAAAEAPARRFPVASSTQGGRTSLEFSVPLESLSAFRPKRGQLFAFRVSVGGSAGESGGGTRGLGWHPHGDNDVDRWGKLMVVE